MNQDAMMLVRSDLLDRIDAIASQSGHLRLAALCDQVDAIRHIARVYKLDPLEQMASSLESALAMDGHGAMILSYLDLMRDAVECQAIGPHVAAAYLGAMSLRMGA